MNRTYDALDSEYDFKDYAFSKLRERYKAWMGNSMEEKLFDSFEMRDGHGKLTNAGALLADDAPIKHSRLFCTRWNGLDKSGGMVDALDSAEYSGSLIILLNEGVGFVKRNMKTRWKKTANSRGLSQILCNHREVVKNRVRILKGGSGASCCRLLYKITAVRGHVKGGGVSLHSSYPLICRQSAAQSGMRSAKNTAS